MPPHENPDSTYDITREEYVQGIDLWVLPTPFLPGLTGETSDDSEDEENVENSELDTENSEHDNNNVENDKQEEIDVNEGRKYRWYNAEEEEIDDYDYSLVNPEGNVELPPGFVDYNEYLDSIRTEWW
jgi:hypothetical protein